MKKHTKRASVITTLCLVTIFSIPMNVSAASRTLLYDLSSTNAVLDSTKGFNFLTGAAEDDTGIYIEARTADDEFPVYYFRGLPNNNVIYGGFCWQILRTTSLGNIKLIYNGLPSNGQCTATGTDTNTLNDIAYAESNDDMLYGGYVYEIDGEDHDSTAKTALDEWFEENLAEYEDELADDVWCNRTDWENNHERVGTVGAPSNECPDSSAQMSVDEENGNGKLTYPVAMITADELMFGGAGYNVENHNYYLTTGNKFHTITQQSGKKMYYQNSKYALNRTSSLTYATGIRAVIALPHDAYIRSGNGSKESPYTAVVPKYSVNSLTDAALVDGADDDTLFAEGDVVRIVSNEGKIGSIVFYDEDGDEVDVEYTINSDGSCSFIMPAINIEFDIKLAPNNPATHDGIRQTAIAATIFTLAAVIIFVTKRR